MKFEKSLIPSHMVPKIKDYAIFAGWILGLILIAGLTWYLTHSLRTGLFIKSINKVLEQSGDSRRLVKYLPAKSVGMGSWFTMSAGNRRGDSGGDSLPEGTRAYVFIFIGDGNFFPCAAVVTPDGNVEEFVPLSAHGKRMIKRISSGILSVYTSRIEGFEL